MIATQQIKSTTTKPVSLYDYETINVLKWNNCKWKNLCPYLLKTDGKELLLNDTSEAFGHGLCLAYSLLLDLQIES